MKDKLIKESARVNIDAAGYQSMQATPAYGGRAAYCEPEAGVKTVMGKIRSHLPGDQERLSRT